MKRIIAIVLTIALIVSTGYVFQCISGRDAQRVFAVDNQSPRDGYILTPRTSSPTGVDPLSSFKLQTPISYVASIPDISIDGQLRPTVIREDNNTFTIIPTIPLTSNRIYIFRLSRDNYADITWAFQTSLRFELTSTLPRNQATNVPVRTGIEISFSFGERIDIENHFSIFPHVEGRFIYRDSTTIFMPTSPLLYEQVYTVTISAGVRSSNTNEVIAIDYVFSFETARKQEVSQWTPAIHFSSRRVEFPSFAPPSFNFWLNYNRNVGRPLINMSIYRIRDRELAIAETNRLAAIPTWSRNLQKDRLVDTSNLTRILSTRIDERQDSERGWDEVFTLRNNLMPGFYVVNAETDGSVNQMIIQVTDLAVKIVADDEKALIWVNDMLTGQPAVRARVFDPTSGKTYETDADGIAIVERRLVNGEYLIITARDGKEAVAFVTAPTWDPWTSVNDNYWTALQLDRTLFQRSDTVSFWGFVQNRHEDEKITHVTAVLTERTWWWGASSGRDTLHTQNIPVEYGAYSGEIQLPNLSPGFYEIVIRHGDIVLNSIFFSVKDYVKPPYQLAVSSSRNAIFIDEEVIFTARTEFFEGTPVSNLNITYHYESWGLIRNTGQSFTNLDGVLEISVRPVADDAEIQGERRLTFVAEATLPEVGWVYTHTSARVFVNDISVRPRATRDGRDANITVNVNYITLDRLNGETAVRWNDYLCAPKAGQVLHVDIIEKYWGRVRIGEFYDHVARQVIPRYRHERRERLLQQFEIVTDADGVATKSFQVPDTKRSSYVARLTTTDGNGRTITRNLFIGRDFTSFFTQANDNRLFLYGVSYTGYGIGNEVDLTIMRGDEPVTQGNFMFVVVSNGIVSYHVGENPLVFTFNEQHVPNARVFAYHFNGHTYEGGWSMSQRLRFNTENRNLLIDVSTCKDAYRPGDMKTLTIRTTDEQGNPKAANVNVSLVDEALFALMDYNVNTLSRLYRPVSDNLRISIMTHRTFVSDGISTDEALGAYGVAVPMAPMAALDAVPMSADDSGGDDTRIRERFEDTAAFASLRTNAQGVATFTFELPDNITSWRMTLSAISDDLYAGNTVKNVRITQPMFIHSVLNNMFLVGDRPYIGVNVYGTGLSSEDVVTFEVWREETPDDIRIATGTSFARVNIPLWEKTEEGFGAIIVRATVAGYSDAVRHAYQVLGSHRKVDVAVFYEVTPGMVFDVNPGGLTNITFTDIGCGRFLQNLFALRNPWWTGARIEGLVARREATKLIETHFPDIRLFGEVGNFDVLEYQTECGGIAILPYAYADLQTTVMLMPFILDDINKVALRDYLRDIFDHSYTENKILALYGLAMLGEPVLLDLQRYAMLEELNLRDVAYIALGFIAIGDTQTARDLYYSRITPHIQAVGRNYRIYTGTNRADIIDATSVVAILATQLGMSESLGLHTYAWGHRVYAPRRFKVDTLLWNIERLTFISHEIKNHTTDVASITYTLFDETRTRDLRRGGNFTLRIPAQNIDDFELISITGEISAVSIVRTPLEEIETVENNIVVRREFFRAGSNVSATTFEQDELVRVQITIDYSAGARSGAYIVTDFLPAGLVHVPKSARFGDRAQTAGWRAWVTAEGQRITFFDFRGGFNRIVTYHYYARVINPGVFMAEGTLVQSRGDLEYIAIGENAILTINP